IGCGGRGTGACGDALAADERVKIVAFGDVFKDRVESSLGNLKQKFGDRITATPETTFVGFDAYQKVLAQDLDYVVLATPPHFRPQHLEAAIKAGKHVFMEKPVAVDPAGCRQVIAAGEEAKKKGLSIVAGTQRRHETPYLETIKRVRDGAIGNVLSGRVYWCGGQLWYKNRQSEWSDMEWMIRDWVNWSWLSGDHICEQHVHNIDIANWVIGAHPVKAIGYGGRARRVTGDQFDFFSVDFEYPEGVHVSSYCRQINDTPSNVSETMVGTKGSTKTSSGHAEITGEKSYRYKVERGQKPSLPYVQEHVDLIESICENKGVNEAETIATSTLSAIMGRIAAYTGREVTWDEVMKSNLRLGPTEYSFDYKMGKVEVPVPGAV
ncbi:MAG: Gfo/Idh/MocA family protein, partial [Planctomycetia bacterium]